METNKLVARLYNKLGMSPDPEFIERRAKCVDHAVGELDKSDAIDLTRCVLGLKVAEAPSFVASMSEVDPTIDLSPTDKELGALASAIASVVLDTQNEVAAHLALTMIAASFGGQRQPTFGDDLLQQASEVLAFCQKPTNNVPEDRTYNKQSKALTTALQEFNTAKGDYGQANQHISSALTECAKYAENGANAAARNDNEILRYIQQLEEETRVQWWVMGGWSETADKPFRELGKIEAAIRAAMELEEKHSSLLGLFAAPALFDLIVSKDRASDEPDTAALSAIATNLPIAWRTEELKEYATGPNVGLLPLCSAMGISAVDEDAADWIPRFQRIVMIDPTQDIGTRQLSLQFYRELLVLREI